MSTTADITVERTITRHDALGPADPDTLADEDVEALVAMEKDIVRSEVLRELAVERLDEDTLPEADSLLWVDQAEVYSLCAACYESKRDAQWTGFTENPHFEELRRQKREALREGRPCTDCREERIKELKAELSERVDIDWTVELDGGEQP